MSRSNYNTVEDRDYESRRERERERSRNADRYDGETRHHGKWTASGEATDLETGSSSFHKERRAGGLGNRSYSDREVLDSDRYDRNRSSSNLGYNSGFGSNYDSYGSSSNYGSSIPVPPPMPPADFYQPHGSYRSSSGYGSHYGSGLGGLGHSAGYGNHYGSGYDHSYGSSGYGSHYGSGLGGLGGLGHSGYGHPSYGTGYGSHYGSGLGGLGHSGYGSSFGHPSYGTGYGHPTQLASLPHTYGPGYQATQIYGSDYYFGQPGYGQSSSSLGSRSRGLGGLGGLGGRKRYGPKTDIYELGNDYVIEMDLPGHQRDHIDIKLAGNELYVISKPPARTHNFHINERSLGRSHVERKFYLPADVTTTSIAPVLTNGVLRLVLPRSALANTTTPLVTPTSVLSSGVKPHTTTVTDTVTTSTSTNQVVV